MNLTQFKKSVATNKYFCFFCRKEIEDRSIYCLGHNRIRAHYVCVLKLRFKHGMGKRIGWTHRVGPVSNTSKFLRDGNALMTAQVEMDGVYTP